MQKDYLNTNSACSTCLCMYEWRICTVLFTTHTETHLMLTVISVSVVSLNEDIMNTVHEQHLQNCSESSLTIIIQR